MSVHAMSVVWKSALRSDLKFVALALADWSDDDGGNIYPSQKSIAAKVGKTDRSVRDSLTALVELGVLHEDPWTEGEHPPTKRYRLNLEALAAPPDAETVSTTEQETVSAPQETNDTPGRKPTSGGVGSPLPTIHQGSIRDPIPINSNRARALAIVEAQREPDLAMSGLTTLWELCSDQRMSLSRHEEFKRYVENGVTADDVERIEGELNGNHDWRLAGVIVGRVSAARRDGRDPWAERVASAGGGDRGAPRGGGAGGGPGAVRVYGGRNGRGGVPAAVIPQRKSDV